MSKEKSGFDEINGRSSQRRFRKKRLRRCTWCRRGTVESQHCSCCSQHVQKSVIGTQTDVIIKETKGKSQQKIIRVNRSYQKDGGSIKKFEEDVWHDYVWTIGFECTRFMFAPYTEYKVLYLTVYNLLTDQEMEYNFISMLL